MLNNQGTEAKYATNIPLDGTVGVKGPVTGLSCFAETQVRVEIDGVGGTSSIAVLGAIRGSTNWTTLVTITGAASTAVDVSTYDYISYQVLTAAGAGTLIASGFFFRAPSSGGGGGAVNSVNGHIGTVVLTSNDLVFYAIAPTTVTASSTVTSEGNLVITKGTGTGPNNTFVGPNVNQSITTGFSNTGFGDKAAGSVSGGASVTAVGHQALGFATSGDASTAVGAMAGRNQVLGGANNYLGVSAGYTNSNGQYNCGFGNGSLYNNVGSNNTAFGYQSGVQVGNGTGNTFLGYQAGYNQTGTVSNKLWIANSSSSGAVGSNLVTGDFALGKVGINVDPASIATCAALQVVSTTAGILFPNVTTTQKNAISSPLAGLVVYDTTLNKLCVYTTAWQTITSI